MSELTVRKIGDAAVNTGALHGGGAPGGWRLWRVALGFAASGLHAAVLAMQIPAIIERAGPTTALAGAWMALAGAANVAGGLAIGRSIRRSGPPLPLAVLYLLRAWLLLPAAPALILGFAMAMALYRTAPSRCAKGRISRQHGLERVGLVFGAVLLGHQATAFADGWTTRRWEQLAGDGHGLLVDLTLALAAAALAAVMKPAARRPC